jgi:hypothetical protein
MTKVPNIFAIFIALSFWGCSSSNENVTNLKELPEICRGYDFNKDPEMADFCGVRKSRYKSYKNIPDQLFLIVPKGAYLSKNSNSLELRLPNTLPIKLDLELSTQFDFSKQKQLEKLKNKYIYKELYPKAEQRIKLFKLELPTLNESSLNLCFRVPPQIKSDRRKRIRQGNQLKKITCQEFSTLVEKHK